MAKVEETVLAEGLAFPEGPAFDANGVLYVCELASRQVTRIDDDGSTEVLAKMGGSPNGLAWGPDGVGYVANGGGRWAPETSTGGKFGNGDAPGLVQRVYTDGTYDTLIAEIDGRPINSPNDLVFDNHGGIYFTDPVWPDYTNPESRNTNPNGTVCYTTIDGQARRLTDEVRFPNGLGVNDDGTLLYVCDSGAGTVVVFDIEGPGKLGPKREFATLGTGIISDGMAIDSRGRVLVAGHGSSRIFVFTPDGALEQELEVQDKDITNVAFGGPDFSTIYTTESDMGKVTTIAWDCPGMKLHNDR